MKEQRPKGQLYYVIGASGAGKDSLLNYVRPLLCQAPVLFAHRYITRPVELSGENHISLTEAEFVNRQQYGCFLFHWQSHGLHYGIGQEAQDWLDAGLNVVMNGSRGYLPEATKLKPDLIPVLITVSLDKLQQRLENRGRESAEQIKERLERASEFDQLKHANLIKVNNDEPLSVAGESLLRILQK
ncbi:MAG: ribose 1,5-bisphosphokinase [Thiomicrorhabdus sp.]|nr:MAG: ribose 1,5-bisphosphokinase [Thiomicrorhabdus sp.]